MRLAVAREWLGLLIVKRKLLAVKKELWKGYYGSGIKMIDFRAEQFEGFADDGNIQVYRPVSWGEKFQTIKNRMRIIVICLTHKWLG